MYSISFLESLGVFVGSSAVLGQAFLFHFRSSGNSNEGKKAVAHSAIFVNFVICVSDFSSHREQDELTKVQLKISPLRL
jgi:hypothetical protein